MKTCSKCMKEKDESEFYTKSKNTKQSYCKQCFNSYCINRWKQKKIDAIKYLGGSCSDCGNVFHPNVMDFHHIKDKDMDWSKARLRSQDIIKKELDKCILLCSNCHRMRHSS